MQALLIVLDRKVDTLINRSASNTQNQCQTRGRDTAVPSSPAKSNDRNQGRLMYPAVCADCKKECKIPFKPNAERPVYCQDCFSKRKVIRLSKIGVDVKPKEIDVPTLQVKTKKKIVKVKKAAGKKKPVPKKK
ncbi:MAG: hypothetical protein HQL12_06650 [Candidatus Omnitrophica bacterium]|nr:hypothetical protein [Candidatus Omnitrophota bacterium]